jgi:IS30 family transposase
MGCYTHLSSAERDQIGIWRAAGRSLGAICQDLSRAKSTIWRELQRNALPSGRSPGSATPTRPGKKAEVRSQASGNGMDRLLPHLS